MYRVTAPNAKLSTETKYGPAKSKITPSSLHIPKWPMKGTSHVMNGSGVHTTQHGNRALLGSIGPGREISLSIANRNIKLQAEDTLQEN